MEISGSRFSGDFRESVYWRFPGVGLAETSGSRFSRDFR